MKRPAQTRVLMIVGDCSGDYEVMVRFRALIMPGMEIGAVCPGYCKGDVVKTAIHDFEGDQTCSEKPDHLFRLTADFGMVEPDDCAGFPIAGGRACEYLRLDQRVLGNRAGLRRRFSPHCRDLSRRPDPCRRRHLVGSPADRLSGRRPGGRRRWRPVRRSCAGSGRDRRKPHYLPGLAGHPELLRAFAQRIAPETLT